MTETLVSRVDAFKNGLEPSKNVLENSKTRNTKTLKQKMKKIKTQQVLKQMLEQRIHAAGAFKQTDFTQQEYRHEVNKNTNIQRDIQTIQKEYNTLFNNQTQFAQKIAHEYANNKQLIVSLAIALTQCGKTGTMLALILHMIQLNKIKLENVFIITGYSSKLWIQQTKQRMPTIIHDNIFHRNTLHKFVKRATGKQNILIITDETHIAIGHNQAIQKAFKQLNLFNIKHMYQNDIKIVNFTATPENIANDLYTWKQAAKTFIMKPPNNYTSIFDLNHQNRILQAKDLCGYDRQGNITNTEVTQNIKHILQFIGSKPKYHIIRTHNGILHHRTILNFKQAIQNDFKFISETHCTDFTEMVKQEPTKHTFIFIKEKLRCSKTLCKHHIGVLYERAVKKTNMASIIQGLAGRLTGYHNNKNSIVFTDIKQIVQYKHLWDNQFIQNNTLNTINTINQNNTQIIHKTHNIFNLQQ